VLHHGVAPLGGGRGQPLYAIRAGLIQGGEVETSFLLLVAVSITAAYGKMDEV